TSRDPGCGLRPYPGYVTVISRTGIAPLRALPRRAHQPWSVPVWWTRSGASNPKIGAGGQFPRHFECPDARPEPLARGIGGHSAIGARRINAQDAATSARSSRGEYQRSGLGKYTPKQPQLSNCRPRSSAVVISTQYAALSAIAVAA